MKLGGGTSHASSELAQFLELVYYSEPEKIHKLREDSRKLMYLFDWKLLISNYIKAYDLAAERISKSSSKPLHHPPSSHPLTASSQKVALVVKKQYPISKLTSPSFFAKIKKRKQKPSRKKTRKRKHARKIKKSIKKRKKKHKSVKKKKRIHKKTRKRKK
ncbi:MAG: hypothetical protein ABIH83_03995 [Candidatus Micrarchaeota archaeon]